MPATYSLEEELFNEIFHYTLESFCFEFHRMNKANLFLFYDAPQINATMKKIIDAPDKDIFGNESHKMSFELECTNCKRMMAASRIAPHLEKCLGMGRNSSRVASRRIAERQQQDVQDDESDDDWSWEKKRKRRDRNSPRRSTKKTKDAPTHDPRQGAQLEDPILRNENSASSSQDPLSGSREHSVTNDRDSQKNESTRDEDYIDVDSYEENNLFQTGPWEISPSSMTEPKE